MRPEHSDTRWNPRYTRRMGTLVSRAQEAALGTTGRARAEQADPHGCST